MVIEELPNYGPVDPLRKAVWLKIRSWRNEVIHSGTVPGPAESRILLDEVNRLEDDLKSGGIAGDHANAAH
jgi:hypothetical protein